MPPSFPWLFAVFPRGIRTWRRTGRLASGLGCAITSVVAFGAKDPTPLPPISGELSGQFTPLKLPGAPTLKWKLSLEPAAGAGARRASLEVEGAGTSLRGQASLEAWDSAQWQLAEGRVEIARWFPTLAPLLGPAMSGMTIQGLAQFSGAGTLRGSEVRGQVDVEVRDGIVRDPAAGWAVEGLAVRGRLAGIPELATDGRVTLTFRDASGYGIAAREGRIEFSIDGRRRIHVHQATMNLMDGRVDFTPFLFDPAQPEVQTHAEFDHVELSRFARFLPALLADATGPVSGRVQISWNEERGLQSASGTLYAQRDAAASIRLAPSPGFLTSRLPENVRERIDLLPKWLGPIRNLFRPANPAYSTLRAIEMGEAPLEITTLALDVTPGGDRSGRTARIVVLAKPAARETVVESVRFEINVTGPLADLIKLGLEGRVKVHAR